MKYDVLYQEWVEAQKSKDYATADKIRASFEKLHAITVFKVGERLEEGVTYERMAESAWQKKYGNPEVGRILQAQDSRSGTKMKSLGYKYLDNLS